MSSALDCVGSGIRSLIRRWEVFQVELHGRYSVERFTSMHKFCESTSVCRSIFILASTPLLSLISVAIVDAIPMKPADLGLAHSGGLWIRSGIIAFLGSYSISWQFCQYVRELKASTFGLVIISIVASAVVLIVALSLILMFWFPFPFTMIWVSGPWMGALALSLQLTRGNFLREHPQVRREVRNFSIILLMQTASAAVYSSFNALYQNVPVAYRPVAAFGVPMFKVTQKNLICRFLRGKDDMKPETVIFYVDITSALFVSSIMQQTTSANTSVLLILIDVAQMLTSLFDLRLMLKSVEDITSAMAIGTNEIIASALLIATKCPDIGEQHLRSDCTSSSKADTFRTTSLRNTNTARLKLTSKARIAPTQGDLLNSSNVNGNVAPVLPVESRLAGPSFESLQVLDRITPRERSLLLRRALEIVFLTEFLLLSEFVEVLTPVMYGCYLMITFHLPNREFYPVFQGLDDASVWVMVRNTWMYGLLEMGTFALLLGMIYRTTHRYPLQQLTFVIKTNWEKLQLRLMIWLLLLLQAKIPQLGTDYTFKFKRASNS